VVGCLSMADQALSTQRSVCSQCMSLWRDLVSRWQRRPPETDSFPPDPPMVREHHQSLIELRNSALDGCRSCSLLWSSASIKNLQMTESLLKANYRVQVGLYPNVKAVGLMMVSAPRELQVGGGFSVNILTLPSSWRPWDDALHSRDSSTASEACFKVAKTWLTDCITTHTPCSLAEKLRKLERGHFTPRRLLKLYTNGTGVCVQLLSEAKAMGSAPEYMTLSHCWGKKQPLMLEKHSLSFLESIVQLKQLPKTYADAVVITLQMVCQYLWIDSLCIVQDSPEDQRAAIEEMSSIYRFSTCNIAALDAGDSTEGALRRNEFHLFTIVQTRWMVRCITPKAKILQVILFQALLKQAHSTSEDG